MSTEFLDKYDIIQKIGEGSSGAVVLARDKTTGVKVAIKQLKKKVKNLHEIMKLRELKVLKSMDHKNIVKLLDVRRIKRTLFLVFEYAEDDLLSLYQDFISKNMSFPRDLLESFAYQAIEGVAYLHSKGIFHRDLKPENLLLVKKGHKLKIADFDLARPIVSNNPFTNYVGTRWYRAPELLLGDDEYSCSVDIFALGCIIGELLLLKPLF